MTNPPRSPVALGPRRSFAGGLDHADLALLVCPTCRQRLAHPPGESECAAPLAGPSPLRDGWLGCAGCGARWAIEDGLPRLYREEQVRGNDRLMRHFYDGLPSLHDPAVRFLLPLLQFGGAAAMRDGYMRRLDLAGLRPRRDRPLRLLEVSIGTGANLPLLRRDLPRGLDIEVWGIDLSLGMLGQCRRRLADLGDSTTRLAMADAHALPFADHLFDRVFHVGGIGGFCDPAAALREMARVAAPGTPIVVVDEELDRDRRHLAWHRLAFRALTFYDADPHCPIECLPAGAHSVTREAISRFYYCLAFRVG